MKPVVLDEPLSARHERAGAVPLADKVVVDSNGLARRFLILQLLNTGLLTRLAGHCTKKPAGAVCGAAASVEAPTSSCLQSWRSGFVVTTTSST